MVEANLLIVSDIHLGCDLIQHLRPQAPVRTTASIRRDTALVAMLDWYRQRRRDARPWRLVIAGDFVDFSGMSIGLGQLRDSNLSPEERRFGLGTTEQHAVRKMRSVSLAHGAVFAALARFIEDGNDLVVIRGNHDTEFFWPEVQKELRAAVRVRSSRWRDTPGLDVGDHIQFADWFYYEPGHVFIEHGHHYDEYCAHAYPLAPLDPVDPGSCARTLSDTLKRYIVNPTPGLTESGHENATMGDYLQFAGQLGVLGCCALVGRFVSAVARMTWRLTGPTGNNRIRIAWEQEHRMQQLSIKHGICLDALKRIAELWRRPGHDSLIGLMGCLMVDRVLLAALIVVWAALMVASLGTTFVGFAAATLGCAAGYCYWQRLTRLRGPVDSRVGLRGGALTVSRELNAPLVVMGHTHAPEVAQFDGATRYVNLGSWAEGDPEEGLGAIPASRTHLVVPRGSSASATLYAWEHTHPMEYRPPAEEAAVESERPLAEPALGYLRADLG